MDECLFITYCKLNYKLYFAIFFFFLDLCHFSLISVLLYDREYRRLQATMGFRWGTDVQHLHTLHLQQRDRPVVQNSLGAAKHKLGVQNLGQKRGG